MINLRLHPSALSELIRLVQADAYRDSSAFKYRLLQRLAKRTADAYNLLKEYRDTVMFFADRKSQKKLINLQKNGFTLQLNNEEANYIGFLLLDMSKLHHDYMIAVGLHNTLSEISKHILLIDSPETLKTYEYHL